MELRTYVITHKGQERLIKSVSLVAAKNYAVGDEYGGDLATKHDLERLLGEKGVQIEIAS